MNYINLDDAQASKCPLIGGTVNYLENFLGKTHPELEKVGHKGTVCPFTPSVLQNGTVSFARGVINKADPEAISKLKKVLVESHLQNFLKIIEPSVSEDKRKLACLLIIMYGLNTEEECTTYVSNVQKEVQPEFVQAGLLLSELHPYSLVPSVRNNEFFPSRPPFPIFFIRRLIPNDIPYLLRRDRYDETTYQKIFNALQRDFTLEVIEKEMARLGKKLE